MSNPNVVNLNSLDGRYSTPSSVDAKIAAQAVTDAGQYAQQWKANTAYTTGQIVIAPDGSTVQAITGFTSSSSYSTSNWMVLSPTSTSIAGTYATQSSVTAGLGAKAPLASPAFTGTPTAPTPTLGDNSTNVSTTAFVTSNALSLTDAASQQTAADGSSKASAWQEFTTRPQRPPSKVVYRFNGSASFTTGAGITEDTTTVLFGDRTMKLVASASGSAATDSPTFSSVQDWSTSIMRFWLKMDIPANFLQGIVYVYMSNGGIASASVSANFQPGEWLSVTIPRINFGVASGTLDWTVVNKITYVSKANSSGSLTAWFGGLDLIPDLGSTYPNGVMIIEMDDGYLGQKTYGIPVVASRGIPVTYNIIGDRFVSGSSNPSGLLVSDLLTLQDTYGWEISCHAYSSAAHGSSVNSVAVMEADFQRQKQWLHANGLHSGAEHYALCPGTGSPVAAGAMMQALEKSFRSIRVNSGFWETAIPGDPLRLRSVLFSGAGNNVTNVKANIDKIAGAGGAFIFAMHDIISGSTDGTSNGLPAIAANNLATILDYAISKGMAFRTRADFIDGR